MVLAVTLVAQQYGARRQGLTLVSISAQLELTLPLSAQLKLTLSPILTKLTRGCVPEVLKLSSNVIDVFLKVLKLSSEVSECKPLPAATSPPHTAHPSSHATAGYGLMGHHSPRHMVSCHSGV